MAETNLKGFAINALTAGLEDIIGLGILKEWMEHRGDIFKRKVRDALKFRGEILLDFANLDEAGKTLPNLKRRYEEAKKKDLEGEFIFFLSLAVKQGKKGRQASLEYLDRLTDPEFDTVFYMLNPDVENQFARRCKKQWKDLRRRARRSKKSLRARWAIVASAARRVSNQVRISRGGAISSLHDFGKWGRERQERRELERRGRTGQQEQTHHHHPQSDNTRRTV